MSESRFEMEEASLSEKKLALMERCHLQFDERNQTAEHGLRSVITGTIDGHEVEITKHLMNANEYGNGYEASIDGNPVGGGDTAMRLFEKYKNIAEAQNHVPGALESGRNLAESLLNL